MAEAVSQGDRLQANSVGVVGVIATSFGAMAPTVGIALGVQFVAIQAGAATPLAFVLTTVSTLAVAYAFIVFSRRVASSGVAFTYLGAAFGKLTGVVGGLLHAGAWVTVIATTIGVASLSFSALLGQAGIHLSWFPIYVVLVAVSFTVCFLGVRLSTRAMLIIELASMATLTVVAVVVIFKGGAAGLTLEPFSPASSLKGIGGLGFALVFAFTSFLGFEASASLGLESANPRRTVPLAMLSSVVLGGIFFLLVSYAVTVGYGVSNAATFANDSTPLDTITARYAGHVAASVVDGMVAVSGLGCAIAAMNMSARVFYNVSHSGLAPRWLGRVHPRFRTPHVGLLIEAGIGLAIAVFVGLPAGPTTMIGVVLGANTIAILVVYAAVSGAAIWMFGRGTQSAARRLATVGIPVVGMAVIVFAIYSGVYPPPAFPYNLTVPLAALWLIIVIVLALRQKDRGVAPLLDAEVLPA